MAEELKREYLPLGSREIDQVKKGNSESNRKWMILPFRLSLDEVEMTKFHFILDCIMFEAWVRR